MASEKVLMGIDIGSSWVRAVVGSVSRDGQLMVDSVCERQSDGIRNGNIVNLELALKAIASVKQEAELQAGAEAQSVICNIGGASIEGVTSIGVAGISAKDMGISYGDISKSIGLAREYAKDSLLTADRQIIHTLIQDYIVDGKAGIRDPLDMSGHRLESRVIVVSSDGATYGNIQRCMQRMGLSQCRIITSQVADSEVVLNSDDKELGTILINIGSDTTDIIAYKNGYPCFLGGVAFGSDNVTSDIAYLLNRPRAYSEQVKIDHGCCYEPSVSDADMVILPGTPGSPNVELPRKELAKIAEARMAEIFALLYKMLDEKCHGMSFNGGVVLVGGGSLLSGACELAHEIFGLPTRIGFPEALPGLDRLYIDPRYTTVLGLIKFEVGKSASRGKTSTTAVKHNAGKKGFLNKISDYIKTII